MNQKSPHTFIYVRHAINTWRWQAETDIISKNAFSYTSTGGMRPEELHFWAYMKDSGTLANMERHEPRKQLTRFRETSTHIVVLIANANYKLLPMYIAYHQPMHLNGTHVGTDVVGIANVFRDIHQEKTQRVLAGEHPEFEPIRWAPVSE